MVRVIDIYVSNDEHKDSKVCLSGVGILVLVVNTGLEVLVLRSLSIIIMIYLIHNSFRINYCNDYDNVIYEGSLMNVYYSQI